jgi:hypothetical protein
MDRGWEFDANVIHVGFGESMEGKGWNCVLHRQWSGEGTGRHRNRHNWVSNCHERCAKTPNRGSAFAAGARRLRNGAGAGGGRSHRHSISVAAQPYCPSNFPDEFFHLVQELLQPRSPLSLGDDCTSERQMLQVPPAQLVRIALLKSTYPITRSNCGRGSLLLPDWMNGICAIRAFLQRWRRVACCTAIWLVCRAMVLFCSAMISAR